MLRSKARSASITSQESYSAVMITDLVADVNVTPELEERKKSTKEETNLAFDGHADGDVKKNSLEDADSSKINGSGISKGVILNAVQFSSDDSKKTFDEKPMQLTTSLAVPTLTQPKTEPKGFKDMTLARKIAFGFSFLPSIFFVLCFAVILPCKVPKPCVDEAWRVIFNNTEPLSRLELADKIVLTAFKDGGNVVLELEKTKGKFTEIELSSHPAYFKCGKITYDNQTDCIVMDDSGKIFKSNKNYSESWNPGSETENLPPSPLIFSGCSEKLDNIAVVVSNTNIKILHDGNKVSTFKVTDCDSVPVKLSSWKKGNSSDILFICDKDGEDRLVRVPSNAWCISSPISTEKSQVLKFAKKAPSPGSLDSLKESIIKPLEDDGLVLWFGNSVSMIQSNGTTLWTASNLSLPVENRFILHGKFLGEQKHLALISSDLTSGLQVTILNPTDGSHVKKLDFENTEALEVIHIKGKKRDFAVLLVRKLEAPLDSMTAALTRISDISSTIVSILSNENLDDGTSAPTVEELVILDLELNLLDSVKQIKDAKDSAFKSTMAANTDEDGMLSVYVLSTLDYPQMKITEVKNINIANWDKSSKYKCLAKK